MRILSLSLIAFEPKQLFVGIIGMRGRFTLPRHLSSDPRSRLRRWRDPHSARTTPIYHVADARVSVVSSTDVSATRLAIGEEDKIE